MKCPKCGFETWDLSEFVLEDKSPVCLDCAGFAPNTCGEMGDY